MRGGYLTASFIMQMPGSACLKVINLKNFSGWEKSFLLKVMILIADFFKTLKNVCEFCNKEFGNLMNMKIHIRTVHDKIKNFVCKKCDKAFGQSSHLRSLRKTSS